MKSFSLLLSRYQGELLYTLSSIYRPIVRLGSSFIVASFVTPVDFGIIQSIMLIGTYLAFMHLGVFNGLNRNLAFYKAQDKHIKVQRMVNSSFYVSILVSLAGVFFGLAILFYLWINEYSLIHFLSAVSLLVMLIFNPFILHYDTTFRSGREFKKLGKTIIFQNTIFGAASLTTYFFGFIGKIIADISNYISGFVFRYIYQPIKATGIGNKEERVELLKVGFPLLLNGYFLSLFNVADQSLIALILGAQSLGYYTISKMILLAIPIIPSTLGVMLYPRASAQYGKTKDNRKLRSFFYKALFINIIVLLPLCAILYILIPVVIKTYLPDYEPGIRAAQINLLTCLTFLSYGPSIIIGVVRRNTPYIVVTGIVLLIFWLIGVYQSNSGASIETIAYLRLLFSTVLSAFALLYSYYLTTQKDFRE